MKKKQLVTYFCAMAAGGILAFQAHEVRSIAKVPTEREQNIRAVYEDGSIKVRSMEEEGLDLSCCEVELEDAQYIYNFREQEPEVTVTYDGTVLESGWDYSVSYEDNINAGEGKVIVTGCGAYTGVVTKTFTIAPKDISKCKANLNIENFYYDGEEKEAVPNVYDGSVCLVKDEDYVVSYENNVEIGTGKADIEGIGNYTGEIELPFTIAKTEQTIFGDTTYSKKYNSKPFVLNAYINRGDGTLSYVSSNTKVATVDAKGKVTIKKAGKAVITVTASETEHYKKTTLKVTIVIAAKKKILKMAEDVCRDGRYIYYSYNGGGVSMGLKRYDTKTGKKKDIKKMGKHGGEGYNYIQIKGKYIYVEGAFANGSDGQINYIYRMTKDGKKKKRLAKGRSPILIGSYIYYMKTYYDKEMGIDYDTNVIYRMKLDGTGKKVVKKLSKSTYVESLARCDNKPVYLSGGYWATECHSMNGRKIDNTAFEVDWNLSRCYSEESGLTVADAKEGNYKYYTNKKANTLYRKNVKTGKVNKVMTCKGKESIGHFRIYGAHVMVNTSSWTAAKKGEKYNTGGTLWENVYCVKGDGTKKKKLEKWQQAG